MRSRLSSTILFAGVLLLPLAWNVRAHQGYFEDDDLATFTWSRYLPLKSLVYDIPSLRYPPEHNRPTGFLYYGALLRKVGLSYPPWTVTLQIIGVVNVALLWFFLQKLGFDEFASAVACVFFACSRALFDAWWKPMFVYDVLCTTFALGSLLAYAYGKWLLSFLALWLAIRSKEVGIFVPAILLGYELLAGERKWKRVVPFLLPVVVYGAYGMWYSLHLNGNNPYRMRFSPSALWATTSFYASKVLWIPYAGFVLPVLALFLRDKRFYLGLLLSMFGIAIYLVLPGRMFAVYLYLAMTGIAVAIAVLASRNRAAAGVLAVAWLAWQYTLLHREAGTTLAAATERKAYVAALRKAPEAPVYVYADPPADMHIWGVEGALKLFQNNDVATYFLEQDNLPAGPHMELLTWNHDAKTLRAAVFVPERYTQIEPAEVPEDWQMAQGWTVARSGYRGVQGAASVRLYRPATAKHFHLDACGSAGSTLRVSAGGQELAPFVFHEAHCATVQTELTSKTSAVVTIGFKANSTEAAIEVAGFGFSTD